MGLMGRCQKVDAQSDGVDREGSQKVRMFQRANLSMTCSTRVFHSPRSPKFMIPTHKNTYFTPNDLML